jgi:hypothetical protein
MDILIGGVLLALALWSILVAFDNGAAGGWIFDRGRWPFVVGAWVLVALLWGGRGAYGIWHEGRVAIEQRNKLIEVIKPHRKYFVEATGSDPLAEFITESGTESDENKR